jgi:hypothetical protein
MSNNRRIQDALRASLDKEDVSLSRRLPGTAPRTRRRPKAATAEPVPLPAPVPQDRREARPHDAPAPKAVKRVQKTFSLTRDDVEILRALRDAVRANGTRCSRSALVRVALHLLDTEDVARVREMVGHLPPLVRRRKGSRG